LGANALRRASLPKGHARICQQIVVVRLDVLSVSIFISMLPIISRTVTRFTPKSWQVFTAAFLISSGSALAVSPTPSYTFSHLAGALAGPGSIDGNGNAAHFFNPREITGDAQGNLYIGDEYNFAVRKISPSGDVTTLAGDVGVSGVVDATGSAARFGAILGLAVDSTGNVYVADESTGVRKITPAGAVTTLAGQANTYSFANGTGNQAKFNNPTGITIDSSGNLYVSDAGNNVIRKVTPAGVVTTFAGTVGTSGHADGTATTATFVKPGPITIDSAGNLYVADNFIGIRKITPAGVVTTLAGSVTTSGYLDATGTAARFAAVTGLSVDPSGNIYAADIGSSTVRKITAVGVVTTISGTANTSAYIDGIASSALFIGPSGVFYDSAGNLFITDASANTVRKLSGGNVVSTIAGNPAWTSLQVDGTGTQARFNAPYAEALAPSGDLYLIDGYVIRKVTPAGVVTTIAGHNGPSGAIQTSVDGQGTAALFAVPRGLCVDASGTVYVTDNAEIRKISPTGNVTTFAGSTAQGWHDGTGTAAKFASPDGIAIGPDGNLYVADSIEHMIRKITPAGEVTTFAGTLGANGHVDGAGSQAQFGDVGGVAFDSAGNLYVGDGSNGLVRKIAPDATVSTVTMSQQLGYVHTIAVDAAGNIFTSDNGIGLYMIQTDGTVSSLCNPLPDDVDGVGQAAYLNGVASVVVDSTGALDIADLHSGAIRRAVPTANVAAITISASPSSVTISSGANATFTVTATSTAALHYNWQALAPGQSLWVNLTNSGSFSGTTTATLTITGATASLSGVQFRCVVTNDSAPNAISSAATLVIGTTTSQLSDIATRSQVNTGAGVEIAGFIISGTQPQTVLIRASGPFLQKTGIPQGFLADPVLQLYSGSSVLLTNDNWGDDPTQKAIIAQATAAVNAPAWDDGSKDAAIVTTLAPGGYTAIVSGKNGSSGIALVEVFALNANITAGTKLSNIATRSYSGAGGQVQIAGFIISGTSKKKVLIRATGPTLSTPTYGSIDSKTVLADPKIDLYDSHQNIIATNDNWDASTQQPLFKALGVDFWAPGSKDSAIVMTLDPGGYTAIVSGADGGTGVALVEVFDADGN